MRVYLTPVRNFLLISTLSQILFASIPTAWAGSPRCFMHGIISPRSDNKEKTTLSDMIRLHFDIKNSDDKAKCEQMMESYCIHNVKNKDYSAKRLKASFKADTDKSEETTYELTDNCKLESSD